MDRTGTCKSESTSVKVKITDTCDCSYGPNSQSNSRWCCGDQPHLDMSQVCARPHESPFHSQAYLSCKCIVQAGSASESSMQPLETGQENR